MPDSASEEAGQPLNDDDFVTIAKLRPLGWRRLLKLFLWS
jgi:hypothetical protein